MTFVLQYNKLRAQAVTMKQKYEDRIEELKEMNEEAGQEVRCSFFHREMNEEARQEVMCSFFIEK